MDGLETISDEVAAALGRQKGPLGLHGITTLSDTAARHSPDTRARSI
jgi:hypothetical protein